MEQAVISIDGHTFGKTYIPDEFTKKFAELLVKECMLLVEGYTLLDWEDGADKVIKEHFGVEE
jgi:hypothetical protein